MSLSAIIRTRMNSCKHFCLVACTDLFGLDTDFVCLVVLKHVLKKGA
jgi:hypothetical protein